MAAADMRARVESRGNEAPRQLALPERIVRHKEQEVRLKGLKLNGEYEISHALQDLIVNMIEKNSMRYVDWEQCTTRDQELEHVGVDP